MFIIFIFFYARPLKIKIETKGTDLSNLMQPNPVTAQKIKHPKIETDWPYFPFEEFFMKKIQLRIITALAVILSILFFAQTIQATNGMLMTSYGARYAGMAGAILAVGGSVMDLESNPANLSRLKNGIFEMGISLMSPELTYRDSYYPYPVDTGMSYQNTIRSERKIFPLPYIGYAAPITDRLAWGISFYAQGGMGAEFKGTLRPTPGGSTLNRLFQDMTSSTMTIPLMGDQRLLRERTYSNLGYAKTTIGASYKIGNSLHIGAGVDVGAAMMEWEWTFSDPSGRITMPGAGYRYKSDTAYGVGGKVGILYEITENFAASYSYTGRSHLSFNGSMDVNKGMPYYMKSDGTIDLNRGAPLYFLKPSVSTYLEYPDKHGVGFAYDNKKGLIIGLSASRINWAPVMNTVEFDLSLPWIKTPFGNYTNEMAFNMKWRNQNVYAVGVEYRPDTVAYRIGYNYGTNPVSSAGVNPLFPAITEHHLAGGLGFRFGKLDFDMAAEYAFPATVKGSMMSDWTVLHALITPDMNGFKNPYYKYSVSMQQTTATFGIKYKL